MNKHLITLYARSPIHVGSGTSVEVVDLPIMRERITAFPVIPSTSLKGVLLQYAREKWGDPRGEKIPDRAKILFGFTDEITEGNRKKQISAAGCVQIMEAKILAFPVRSLAGCFAWLTCPLALERFSRDTGKKIKIPEVNKDSAIAGADVIVNNDEVVLEEFALKLQPNPGIIQDVAKELAFCSNDPVWKNKLTSRLVIVHDENFQHFVTTCTEITARIKIDPKTRTTQEGALFNQENVPSESLFYSVLNVLPPRKQIDGMEPNNLLSELLPDNDPRILQIGGDETTGFGLCEVLRIKLN